MRSEITKPYIVSCSNVYSRCHPPVEVENPSDISKNIFVCNSKKINANQRKLILMVRVQNAFHFDFF